MSRDQSGRSKWSREQAQISNAVDRFFPRANSLVISVVSRPKSLRNLSSHWLETKHKSCEK